jgi:hypothetical protein
MIRSLSKSPLIWSDYYIVLNLNRLFWLSGEFKEKVKLSKLVEELKSFYIFPVVESYGII